MSDSMSELRSQLRPYLANLMDFLEETVEEYADDISQVHPTHQAGAKNLLRYAQLRNHDVAHLQAGLSSLGGTRLSTAEPDVIARLQAAHNVLDVFNGDSPTYPLEPIGEAFAKADDILDDHATELLGPTKENTHARIMVTLPSEAADDPDLVLKFAEAGMDLARINCAHDGEEAWAKMIDNVHAAADAVGHDILVSMDLAGPKVRTGDIEPGPAVIRARVTRDAAGKTVEPAKLYLYARDTPQPELPTTPGREGAPLQVDPAWLKGLAVGSVITLEDNRGKHRSYRVERIRPDGLAIAHGKKSAFIAASTLLLHDGEVTTVSGIAHQEQKINVVAGDTLILTTNPASAVVHERAEGVTTTLGCDAPEAIEALEPGHQVLFDDGAIDATVKEVRKVPCGDGSTDTEAVLEVTRAGIGGTNLKAHKGINLPDTFIPLPSLTEEDLTALEFVARNADIVNVSFIRTAGDVVYVLDQLADIAARADKEGDEDAAAHAKNLGVVLKIETVPAYHQLAAVLLAGMRHRTLGIMIARGDLAVELGFERMVEIPRLMMQMAEAAHIPVILATQVLENLAKKGLPSRAEMTDVGYALRAECVMLNKGPNITEAIRILDRVSRRLGRSQLKNRQSLRKISAWEDTLKYKPESTPE